MLLWHRPYEPFNQAPYEVLTRKTAFLLALAIAARVSKIHAIDVTRIRFEQMRHGAMLGHGAML